MNKPQLLEMHRELMKVRNYLGREVPSPETFDCKLWQALTVGLHVIADRLRDMDDAEKNFKLFPAEVENYTGLTTRS